MSSELPTLQITANGVQRTYPLCLDRYRIGRSTKADIQLSDYRVSRCQAILFREPQGRCLLVDGTGKTGSRNGTFVNGVRIKRRVLEDQDVLFLGSPGVTAQILLPHRLAEASEDPLAGEFLLPDEVPTEIGVGLGPVESPSDRIHWSLLKEFQGHGSR